MSITAYKLRIGLVYVAQCAREIPLLLRFGQQSIEPGFVL